MNLSFGDKYKLEIIPIAEYETLDDPPVIQNLELGKKEKEFILSKLQIPTIAVRGSRIPDNTIRYSITIYDNDRIIENNKYTIKILDDQLNDITPEDNKVEYDVDIVNNVIDIRNIESNKSYTILVIVKLDYDNDKIDLQDYSKQYKIPEVNEYGITIGEVTPSQNTTQSNKIDLIFNNSYKLTDIETIRYSIYNTNGYAQSGKEEFIPKQYVIGTGDVYYTYTLEPQLSAYGKYIIELQFIKEDKTIENVTLEYVYRDA